MPLELLACKLEQTQSIIGDPKTAIAVHGHTVWPAVVLRNQLPSVVTVLDTGLPLKARLNK